MNEQPKPLVAACRGSRIDPPPIWLMRQAGRYLPEYREIRASVPSFLGLCMDARRAAEVTLQPIRRFGLDGAILFSDILVIPYALGQAVDFESGSGPRLSPVRSRDDLRLLARPGVEARLAPVYEAIERVASVLPAATALIGFAGAPWTVATYMVEGRTSRDFVHSKSWAHNDPAGFADLIGLLTEVTVDHLCAQVRAGAEAVQIFDTWAGALSADAFRRYSAGPVMEIARRVKKQHPEIPVIAFLRGVPLALPVLAACPDIDVISMDYATDARWAAGSIQPQAAVQGNLDPVILLTGGAQMIEHAQKIISSLARGPHIFNLGHGILPGTPPEHVAGLVETVRGGRS